MSDTPAIPANERLASSLRPGRIFIDNDWHDPAQGRMRTMINPATEEPLTQVAEERFRVRVQDNGPGIVKQQIPNVFGKLLYGSKFHRLKMSRGSSAACAMALWRARSSTRQ